MDRAITSNTIKVDVDQLVVSKSQALQRDTYIMGMSRSAVRSGIEVDKCTMSWRITLGSTDIDIDQLY